MQKSSLPTTHPLMGIQAVSKAIALPGMHAPQRYPTFPALERTAVLGFSAPLTVNLPASGTTQMLLFRQAAYPFWSYVSIAPNATGRATWYVESPDDSANQVTYQSMPVSDMLVEYSTGAVGAATADRIGTTGAVGAYPLASGNVIMGKDSSHFIHIPANSTWSIIVTSTTSSAITAEVTVHYETWQAPGEVTTARAAEMTTVTLNRGVALETSIVQTLTGIWVRPSHVQMVWASNSVPWKDVQVTIVWSARGTTYTPSATTRGSLAFLTAGGNLVTLFPLCEPNEFANSRLPWFATRTTAASMLGTNVTQLLNKGGTVLAGRFSPAVQNPWAVTTATINTLHPAEKAFLPLETGVYTYVPPSTDLQEFYDYTSTANGTLAPAVPVFNLANNAMYNVLAITATSVAETLAVTIDWHIEFRTSSALFNIGTTTMSLEGLHQAQLILNELGFFFDNPDHKTILMSLVSKAKKYIPKVIGMVNPVAGGLARRAIKFMDRTQLVQRPKQKYNRMKPTSSKASGFNGKPKAKQVQGKAGQPKMKSGLDMYLQSRGGRGRG